MSAPIICVPGFLAMGDIWDISTLRRRFPSHRFITVKPGPVSSHHDRAVEIFYALKGGVADYGREHAAQCGHARFGRRFDAAYPEWDASHPIHLLGHSIGGQTVRVLQHLLATQAFEGHATSADWVCSLTALSSPLNGDWAPYALGASVAKQNSSVPTIIRCGSVGWLLTMVVHVLCFLGLKTPDLQLDHWRLSVREHGAGALYRLVSALLWWPGTSVGQSPDNAAHEVCYHNTVTLNRKLAVHPRTYYFSFVARRSTAGSAFCAATWFQMLVCLLRTIFLNITAWCLRRGSRGTLHAELLVHCGLSDGDTLHWGAHDGLLAMATQTHPHKEPHVRMRALSKEQSTRWFSVSRSFDSSLSTAVVTRPSRSPQASPQMRKKYSIELQEEPPSTTASELQPGVWHVQELCEVDHFSVACGPWISSRSAKELFWDRYISILDAIYEANGGHSTLDGAPELNLEVPVVPTTLDVCCQTAVHSERARLRQPAAAPATEDMVPRGLLQLRKVSCRCGNGSPFHLCRGAMPPSVLCTD
ncbi:hypothetical protein AB1Y20_002422 [Prymnesium parvum]|uniref:Lipase-like C-terminal domain-containing protein n=1 Tax=Prymnesium parvum TaxID=97485 RepID=A0AB34JB17_PRYPA